jgi:glycosyltransferase involved in cell wall biosynthesis
VPGVSVPRTAVGAHGAAAPAVLWWGRFDAGYSRNAILRQCFEALGWQVCDFRPWVSRLGDLQARLRAPAVPALVWVPCFRQRDLAAARRHARRLGVPLVADPLISAYDKQVGERGKFAAGSARALRLLGWERRLLAGADRVVADTHGHADYFAGTLAVPRDRLTVVPVGADETRFAPAPMPAIDAGVEALFYGSFLALQGPDVIVAAAARVRAPGLRITLLGHGPLQARCVALAGANPRLHFEPWVAYERLAARIHHAHILLGAFGVTDKAARVIPNKVYQSLACARPVITRAACAYPPALRAGELAGLRFIPAGDAGALAGALDAMCQDAAHLPEHGRAARTLYERWFGARCVRGALAALLSALGLPVAGDSSDP